MAFEEKGRSRPSFEKLDGRGHEQVLYNLQLERGSDKVLTAGGGGGETYFN